MTEINGYIIDQWNVHGFEINGKTEGKVDVPCPFCSEGRKKKNDKCATAYLDTGWFKCHHCGEEGQLHTYKRSNQEREYVKPPIEKISTEYSANLLKWFKKRGISENTLQKFKVSEGKEWMPQTQKEENTVKFTYFINNEPVNIKYRDGRKNFKLFKGAEKVFYNLDSIRNTKECVIVEGEIDALSIHEAGITNVVSVPNGFNDRGDVNTDYVTTCYEFFENKEKIILAVDNDEAGKLGEAELTRRFGAEKVWLVNFGDCKDANEYLIKYGEEELKALIDNATQYPLEDVLTFKDVKSSLYDFYLNGSPKGFTIGLQSFDEIFSTYLQQYIVVTGIPSSGKSEFVDTMAIGYNLSYKWKTAFASPENKPSHLHVDKIFRKIYGNKPQTKEHLESNEVEVVSDHVENNFFFIDFKEGYDLINVLRKAEELIKRKGIKVLVIDPFNKVRLKESLGKSINDYTNDYLNTIDTFCKKYNILIILVAHPTKLDRYNGNREEPDMYSIKGGGEFYDMSPHGLLVHRDYDKKLVKVKVLKVKFSNLGDNFAERFYGWNGANGRYSEIIGTYEKDSLEAPKIVYSNVNWITGNESQDVKHQSDIVPKMSPTEAFALPPDSDKFADDEVPF